MAGFGYEVSAVFKRRQIALLTVFKRFFVIWPEVQHLLSVTARQELETLLEIKQAER